MSTEHSTETRQNNRFSRLIGEVKLEILWYTRKINSKSENG